MNDVKNNQHKDHFGVIVPVITPINEKGELDEAALRKILDSLIEGGVQGVFVLGTTGEGPSVPREWRQRLVHVTLDQIRKRAAVYAGIADPVLAESAALGKEYLRMGVRAVVAQLPSYFTLTPNEQFEYFAELIRRIKGPLVLYDIPPMTHMALDMGVIEHLRAFSNVVGVKDSSGDQERLSHLLETYRGDPNFCILVGMTRLSSFGLMAGADGIVPSTANLNPGLTVRLYASAKTGDAKLTEGLQQELDELTSTYMKDGSIGHGIARLKRLMSQKGLCGPGVLPPLQPVE
jgi:2-dehydro-3-deoxy-D-pentonate aldolase